MCDHSNETHKKAHKPAIDFQVESTDRKETVIEQSIKQQINGITNETALQCSKKSKNHEKSMETQQNLENSREEQTQKQSANCFIPGGEWWFLACRFQWRRAPLRAKNGLKALGKKVRAQQGPQVAGETFFLSPNQVFFSYPVFLTHGGLPKC